MQMTSLVEHLEKLRYFVTVADVGSLLGASKKLHLSQPTLSQSIKTLEKAVGTTLFERTSRGIYLTRHGKKLYEFGLRLINEADALQNSLRLQDESQIETLSIGTKEPMAVYLWPGYMQWLSKKNPSLDVTLAIKRSNDELIAGLVREQLDMIMIPDPPESENYLSYSLYEESYALFAKPSLKVGPETQVFLFLHSMCGGKRTIQQVFKKYQISFVRARDVDSFNVAKAMALKELGIALLPRGIAAEELRKGILKEVQMENFNSEILGSVHYRLCVKSENRKNRRLRQVVTHLREFHKTT